jgi:predicted dehydrogenase
VTEAVVLGLVGCGRLAEQGYLPAVATLPGVRIGAVADPDPARRAHVASRCGACGFPDVTSLLTGGGVDAMVIASPVTSHLADAEAAARAGVAALVEKPPATDAAEASRLAALDPPPWVGFNRRFDPGAQAVRDAIPASGDLDLVLEVRYRRRSWSPHTVRDDALLDLGPHLIDWTRWLTGSDVIGVASAEVASMRATLDLRLERGRARLTAATDRPHRELVEVRDDSGSLLARHRLGGVVHAIGTRLTGAPRPDALVAGLAAEIDAFVRTVRGDADTTPLGLAEDGLAVMQVIDAARTSAERGSSVSLLASARSPARR